MGEPLMYRDAKGRTFEDIIKLCRDYNIKLNLTTNGSFHSPQGHSGIYFISEFILILIDIFFQLQNGLIFSYQF
jgi:hypothetical protein